MKRYESRALKWIRIVFFVSVVTVGFAAMYVDIQFPATGLQIVMYVLEAFLSSLWGSIYFAERSRTVVLDEEKIILPRGVEIDGKTAFTKTEISFDKIAAVKSKLRKGDGLITKDCYFHTIKLKDGTEAIFTLYHYGKEAEEEIMKRLTVK